ncbi:unnamed protein product [Brachionus calyciflorus]|uniref:Uncharacterized protein n=1 Tax=Brachionus calyciflorus TaxID=104777 RepID=A0A813QGX1_9BILA|nr:unnamed protein product [Brachionus calyciflorus]
MSSSDSFSFLLKQITKDLNNINDTLALIGLLYIGKKSIEAAINLNRAISNYLIPALISNEKWLKSLGNWAIVIGCLNQIGYGYARELAKKQINLILIDDNEQLLNRASEILKSNFNIEIITISIDFSNSNSYIPIEKSIVGRDIGILVNSNSFTTEWSNFHALPKNFIEKTISSNIGAFSFISRMIFPSMFQKNKGAIINITSKNTSFSSPYSAITAASNAYSEKLLETWRCEYSDKNLYFQTVNACFVDSSKFNNEIILSDDSAMFTSSAIRTLGWSSYSMGHWLNTFKLHLLMKNFPIKFLNFIYTRILKRKFKNSIEKSAIKDK